MRIQETVSEIRRFVRATKDGFSKLVSGQSGNEFVVNYGLTISTTPINDSEVKSLLEAIDRSIATFSNDGKLSVQLDINHQNGFDGNLLKEVRSGYEASKKIESEAAQAS